MYLVFQDCHLFHSFHGIDFANNLILRSVVGQNKNINSNPLPIYDINFLRFYQHDDSWEITRVVIFEFICATLNRFSQTGCVMLCSGQVTVQREIPAFVMIRTKSSARRGNGFLSKWQPIITDQIDVLRCITSLSKLYYISNRLIFHLGSAMSYGVSD